MSTGMKALNYVGTLFSYGASFLGQMIDPVVDGPAAGVVEADVDKVDCHKHPPTTSTVSGGRIIAGQYQRLTGSPLRRQDDLRRHGLNRSLPECDHRR